jgi:hypothetical protein
MGEDSSLSHAPFEIFFLRVFHAFLFIVPKKQKEELFFWSVAKSNEGQNVGWSPFEVYRKPTKRNYPKNGKTRASG